MAEGVVSSYQKYKDSTYHKKLSETHVRSALDGHRLIVVIILMTLVFANTYSYKLLTLILKNVILNTNHSNQIYIIMNSHSINLNPLIQFAVRFFIDTFNKDKEHNIENIVEHADNEEYIDAVFDIVLSDRYVACFNAYAQENPEHTYCTSEFAKWLPVVSTEIRKKIGILNDTENNFEDKRIHSSANLSAVNAAEKIEGFIS